MEKSILFVFLIISVILIAGCEGSDVSQLSKEDIKTEDNNVHTQQNTKESAEVTAEKFARKWEQKNYGDMYDMFIPSLKSMKTKSDFITISENKEGESAITIRLDKLSLENETTAYAYYSITVDLFDTKAPAMKLEWHDGKWLVNAFAGYFEMEEMYLAKCYDNNVCTTDSYSFKEGKCINSDLPKPCCGDDVCQEKETYPYNSFCELDCSSETIYLGLGDKKQIVFLEKDYGTIKYIKQDANTHIVLNDKTIILDHENSLKISDNVYMLRGGISNLDGRWKTSFIIYKVDELEEQTFTVTRIIDGDTIEIETGERVRFICINTPEKGEYYYQEAKDYLTNLSLNKKVRFVKDVSEIDMYDRLLRYVYLDEIFINGNLVENGYAKVYRYPPDTKLCDDLENLEIKAKNNNLGIWYEIKEEQEAKETTNSGYVCNYDVYNCGDFTTHAKAQAVFEECGGVSNDVHKLDKDKDGVACESLP